MASKNNWNKRMKPKEVEKRIKMNNTFLVKNFCVDEVLDESGEVLDDTVIRVNFDSVLFYLSIPKAMKFNKLLSDILNLKK